MSRVRIALLLGLLALSAGCGAAEGGDGAAVTLAALAPIPTPPVTARAGAPPPVATATPYLPPTATRGPAPAYGGAPTPDPPRPTVELGETLAEHVVSAGETLASIAARYGASVEQLLAMNGLVDPNTLYVGQLLAVPAGASVFGPSLKLIPDSELVYSPSARDFDVAVFVNAQGGYLASYREVVENIDMAGAEIVQLVADRFRVNPRLLLALLEHRSGWLGQSVVDSARPAMGNGLPAYRGLYQQLSWAANKLNLGYYGLQEGGLTSLVVSDGTRVALAPDINAGTVGVQLMLAAPDGVTYERWLAEIGPEGWWATYTRLFGNPFARTVDPLVPADLDQPELRLPWAAGDTWYFTGGPHGGWASGSAWAALDFVPGGDRLGCYPSDEWVRAMADGVVAVSGPGMVVVDLDGDGYAGTGWAIHYFHLASLERAPLGASVRAGDPLGHPSCEGGFSNGTHVHVARTYNGRWIAADGPLPFVMEGWTSQGIGREYDGYLVRGEEVREACGSCREEINAITAEMP